MNEQDGMWIQLIQFACEILLVNIIIRRCKTLTHIGSTHISGISKYVPHCASVRDSQGRMAIHVGADHGLRWEQDKMCDIVEANLLAMKVKDPVTGLPVYGLAAAGEDSSLCTIYRLILLCVDDFS